MNQHFSGLSTITDSPAKNAGELLDVARDMFDEINRIILQKTLPNDHKLAANAAIFACAMYLEHTYSVTNLNVSSNWIQMNFTKDRQYIYDIARIIANENIQKNYPAQ